MSAFVMLVALVLDALVGWPTAIYRKIGHPVGWIGRVILAAERGLNRENRGAGFRRVMGVVTVVLIVGMAVCMAVFVAAVLPGGALGVALTVILVWPFVAAKSLYDHVDAVAVPLESDDMARARAAVSMIVGRNPETLDREGITRAAMESLAENASDGVVAPLFWGALFGLPGIVGYKAINTLDSMIGYRNARYGDFGWAAARLDDVANWIPARLTGVLIAIASGKFMRVFSVMRRDARKHRSPNAGWPETAMAATLGVRLSGPRMYDGVASGDPWLNGEAPDPLADDLRKGLRLYRRALVLGAVLLGLVALAG